MPELTRIGRRSTPGHPRRELLRKIFVGKCMQRIDGKTGEITDAQTKDFVKQQLAAFAKFIGAHGGKS